MRKRERERGRQRERERERGAEGGRSYIPSALEVIQSHNYLLIH